MQADTLKKAAGPILKKLTALENDLIQTRSHAHEDPLNYPVKLNNKLTELASAAGSDFAAPTQQEYDVFRELSQKVDARLNALHQLVQNDLPRFNALVKKLDIPAVALPGKAGK